MGVDTLVSKAETRPCAASREAGRREPALEKKVGMASSTPSPFPVAWCHREDSDPATLVVWRDLLNGCPWDTRGRIPADWGILWGWEQDSLSF